MYLIIQVDEAIKHIVFATGAKSGKDIKAFAEKHGFADSTPVKDLRDYLTHNMYDISNFQAVVDAVIAQTLVAMFNYLHIEADANTVTSKLGDMVSFVLESGSTVDISGIKKES